MRVLTLALLLGASACLAGAPLSILSISVKSRPALEALQSKVSLDFIDVRPDEVLVAANPEEIELLDRARIPFAVVYQDANDLVGEVRPLGVGAYHTYAKVTEKLAAWAAAMPSIASVTTIGTSAEGRAIPAIKLEAPGRVPAAERPKLLFMGLHHAREWISVEVPMALIGRLLEGYTRDESLRQLLETRTIWVVPVVNPDGLEYSQTKYTMWRKNRHKTWSLPGVNGVDPNRNYGFEWSGSGSSGMPFSEVYRGPSAFSEPETQAIKAFAEREKFTASISFHSFSELVLFPWGYTRKLCNDDATFRRLATEMAGFNKYRPQTGADLYLVNGECDDWLYGTMGVWAFTIELGKSFIPKDAEIPKITGPNVQAALHLIGQADRLAGDPGVILNLVERLAGVPGAARGPWSPGVADEGLRRRTLAWATAELGQRLSALAHERGEAAVRPLLARLASHHSRETEAARRAVEAALGAR